MPHQQTFDAERQRDQREIATGIGDRLAARLEPVASEKLPEMMTDLLARLAEPAERRR